MASLCKRRATRNCRGESKDFRCPLGNVTPVELGAGRDLASGCGPTLFLSAAAVSGETQRDGVASSRQAGECFRAQLEHLLQRFVHIVGVFFKITYTIFK